MRRNDLILIGTLLLIAGGSWLLLARPSGAGAYAVVTVDGAEVGRYPLWENQSIPIGTDQYNILTIENGTASITEANCHDFTCVRTGPISQTGESIVCLPHRLVVSVEGRGGVDAVVGGGR